ncbi:alpha-galactosidase [Sanguibacter sp. HDW7]|uniref:alpha-galactosidase n=1 Tax=Sanguibacter sp. HDW7 TaxID=2714931 RepID=UPI001409DDDE|nr:alpha-galactosidase [Sanguibacter sp. HDW7]QIK82493.1 alpha-galactosidase [Sanguibacter sp. HDW7]
MTTVHLRRGGTSVVVSLTEGRLPRILHWGRDLGSIPAEHLADLELATRPKIGDSAVTYPQPLPLLPQVADGWLGAPGLAGSRDGRAWAPLFLVTEHALTDDAETKAAVLVVDAEDTASELGLSLELRLEPSGLLRTRATLRNHGDAYRVDRLELALPVPDRATELLDLTGRWAFERQPQRHPFPLGRWERESRGGKSGLDAPLVMLAGEDGFGWRTGDVWGVHLGWSGNQVLAAERAPAGSRLLRGGELVLPSEVVVERGGELVSPWLYGSWGAGLDELSGRFHAFLRARESHPSSPRPVLVNTWEAVYFSLDLDKLLAFAQSAANLGAERFVVDDGWFVGRKDDSTSLGDWIVDLDRLPSGLEPLAERVHELGMELGLWFEPEMVNLDSDLAREHPEWIFDAGHGPGLPSRYQHVLDLGHEGAYTLVRDRISALVERLGIDYIKWDHNRVLTDAGHSPTGAPGVRRQTLQAYRMMDELRAAHPGLEIESCSSGGGRVDLGVLERTDRVWDSDCNDPHDRVDMQRWTTLLLPPELQGMHIGSEESHTTHRVAPLEMRGATALWGHLGIELDLTLLSDIELAQTRRWVDTHKELRPLLHSGVTVHADTQPEVRLEGVVAQDGSAAVFQYVMLDRPTTWPPAKMRLPGLDPDRLYRVEEFAVTAPLPDSQRPPWLEAGVTLTGRMLAERGLEAPSLHPDRSVLLSVRAVDLEG